MRVTQGMIINNSLNGLYGNMSNINKLYAQMSTGKKIQTVSENPIIAGRSLKLKSTVLETTQYENNVKEANSWMEITEAALKNMNDILTQINTKCTAAASSTMNEENKESIKTDISQLMEQLLQEANTTYNGRYVFSGYKTNEPLVLTKEMTLDNVLTVVKDMTLPGGTSVANGSVIKDGSSLGEGTKLGQGTTIPSGSVLKSGTTVSAQDAVGLLGFDLSDTEYTLDADYTIKEGTKLSKEAAEELGLVPKGTLNDGDTFEVPAGGSIIPKGTVLTKASSEEVLGITPSKDTYTTTADLTISGDYTLNGDITLTGGSTMNGDITLQGDSQLGGGTVLKQGSTMEAGSKLPKGAFNPAVYGKVDGQNIGYEVGTNNTIDVNTVGMDEILGGFVESMQEIITMVDASQGDNPKYSVEELSKMFDNKLNEIKDIASDISEKTADLGSRMKRVEYVETRLVDQKTTFKKLLSETEDIDIEETYVQFNAQYATYQSALQATSKVITNTLADYL